MSSGHHYYLIAGEPSGDFLGACLIRSLKAQHGHAVFSGVGGPLMEAEGLQPYFPMQDIALMGFAEIIPHIPRLLQRIRQTVRDIHHKKPDAVITIDSPGFNFRVAKALKNAGSKIPRIHYVAPSVWAYKPERAQKTARLFDHLLTLLPFEPPYFEAEGLPTHFVGHPAVWESKPADGASFRRAHNIARHTPVLCMLPGSRRSEIARHLPLFREVADTLAARIPALRIVMPVGAQLAPQVSAQAKDWPLPVTLSTHSEEKADALAACNAALVKSGTVTLEVALARVPMVVTYQVNALTAWLLRRLIYAPYITLLNLMAEAEIIPELLQEKATAEAIAPRLAGYIEAPETGQKQTATLQPHLQALGLGWPESPSDKAAKIIHAALHHPDAR